MLLRLGSCLALQIALGAKQETDCAAWHCLDVLELVILIDGCVASVLCIPTGHMPVQKCELTIVHQCSASPDRTRDSV